MLAPHVPAALSSSGRLRNLPCAIEEHIVHGLLRAARAPCLSDLQIRPRIGVRCEHGGALSGPPTKAAYRWAAFSEPHRGNRRLRRVAALRSYASAQRRAALAFTRRRRLRARKGWPPPTSAPLERTTTYHRAPSECRASRVLAENSGSGDHTGQDFRAGSRGDAMLCGGGVIARRTVKEKKWGRPSEMVHAYVRAMYRRAVAHRRALMEQEQAPRYRRLTLIYAPVN